MSRRSLILALISTVFGLALTAYAEAADHPMTNSPTPQPNLVPPPTQTIPGPQAIPPQVPLEGYAKSFEDQKNRTELGAAQVQSNQLGQRLGPDSAEAQNLQSSVREAERRLDALQTANQPADAADKSRLLDDSMRDVEKRRLQAEDKLNGWR